MEIQEQEKRRASNLIWNAAQDYDFEPDFKAFDEKVRQIFTGTASSVQSERTTVLNPSRNCFPPCKAVKTKFYMNS